MRIIKPSIEVLDEINGNEILRKIEKIGRVCYKSEERITNESSKVFIGNLKSRINYTYVSRCLAQRVQ